MSLWLLGISICKKIYILLPHEFLHELSTILSRMEISVCCVFTKVFFFVAIFTGLISWTVLQNVNFELLTFHHFEVVHGLSCHLRFCVMLEFNNRMALIFASVRIFWKLNCINTSEWAEPFSDVLLRQCCKLSCQSAHVNPIVLLSVLMLITRCQCVSNLGKFILIIPIQNFIRFFPICLLTSYIWSLLLFYSSLLMMPVPLSSAHAATDLTLQVPSVRIRACKILHMRF